MNWCRVVCILILLTAQRIAVACQCGAVQDPASAFASADAVFLGTVVSLSNSWGMFRKLTDRVIPPDPAKLDHDDYYERYGFRATVTVMRIWKGKVAKRTIVVTGHGGGDCGFEFSKGVCYLSYTYLNKFGNHTTGICTRTTECSRSSADLTFLGTPKAPP